MSSEQLIANECLAFIQHAIDSFDEVTIVRICSSNFNEDEVSSAKKLLFQTLGKSHQMPSRRRDGGEKSLQDIITLLKETDPDDVPVFVAKRLDRVPPVTWEHLDCCRLLKDITALKTTVAELVVKLAASENIIGELRTEVMKLQNTATVCRSTDDANINTRRGAQNASVGSFESANLNTSPVVDTPPDAPLSAARSSAAAGGKFNANTSTPRRTYAIATAREGVTSHPEPQKKAGSSVPPRLEDNGNDDGFKKVQNKKKKKPSVQNKCGTAPTGPNHLLRPETPTTLLYVSRVHYSITAEEVAEYVLLKTKLTLRVVKLESRHNVSFNSFVLRVPAQSLNTFMAEEFWPRGVKFRRFRGRLPDTRDIRRTS